MARTSVNSQCIQLVFEEKNNLDLFGKKTNEGLVDVGNAVFRAACKLAQATTPVHQGEYPPSRNRVNGTMRRSIKLHTAHTYANGNIHPCKITMDTWLWDWIDNVDQNKYRRKNADKIKAGRRRSRTKSLKRFKGMIQTDPRRLLGEPVQRCMNMMFNKRLEEKMQKILSQCSVKGE